MPTACLNGIEMQYAVQGQGPPLVLIMGLGGRLQAWYFQVRAFRKHYRVITFDNRGVGRTADGGHQFTVQTMADDTIGLLDHLAIDRTHLLGYSLGGIVAQEIAIRYPDRVRTLMLVSTIAVGPGTTLATHESLQARVLEEPAREADVDDPGLSGLMPALVELSFARPAYRLVLKPLAGVLASRGGLNGLDRQVMAPAGANTIDHLHEIQAPTLVMTGTRDRVLSPDASQQLAARIPGARLVMVEGGSHAFAIEMRGRFNDQILRFLGEYSAMQ